MHEDDDREQAPAPRLVRRSPIARVSKLCPACLSPLTGGSELGGWLIPQDYYCEKCGYRGYAYLEPSSEKGDRGREGRGGESSAGPDSGGQA